MRQALVLSKGWLPGPAKGLVYALTFVPGPAEGLVYALAFADGKKNCALSLRKSLACCIGKPIEGHIGLCSKPIRSYWFVLIEMRPSHDIFSKKRCPKLFSVCFNRTWTVIETDCEY